jgi:hypothetical protein
MPEISVICYKQYVEADANPLFFFLLFFRFISIKLIRTTAISRAIAFICDPASVLKNTAQMADAVKKSRAQI